MEDGTQFYYSRSRHEDSKPRAARHTSVLREQFASVFCSLLDNPDMNHHFPTLGSEATGKLLQHMFSQGEDKLSKLQSSRSQYKLTVSMIMARL